MYNMLNSSMRGGISTIITTFAQANNHYMTNYDENHEDSFLFYIDKNNLHGEALCEMLPHLSSIPNLS